MMTAHMAKPAAPTHECGGRSYKTAEARAALALRSADRQARDRAMPSASSIPRLVAKNPVMFVVEVGSVVTTYLLRHATCSPGARDLLFNGQITLWLWFTVLFANFAEAMAEGRGKAQADALRKTKTETMARKLRRTATARSAFPAPSCARATSSSARRATSSPATAT